MRPPQYLEQVEQQIGLPFFADPVLAEQVRADPGLIDPQLLAPRATLYFAGLRLLSTQQGHEAAPSADEDVAEREAKRLHDIRVIRAELMLLDPGLETPAIRGFRQAFATANRDSRPRTWRPKTRRPSDILSACELPVGAVSEIVPITPGAVLRAIRDRDLEFPRRKLPGQAGEVCCDWSFVRLLVDLHGLRTGVEDRVDLSMLPRSPDEDDPLRLDYARQLQLQFVAPHKLQNVPELADQLPAQDHPEARPYHLTRNRVSDVLGGSYHFVEDYCRDSRFGYTLLKMVGVQRLASYMLLEEAAEIWDAYRQIPEATPNDITLIAASSQIEVSKAFFRDNLAPEEQMFVTIMRALEPRGRVLPHLRRDIARIAMERLQRRPLRPHLIPAQALDRYFAISYSGVMAASYTMQERRIPQRLHGTNKTQSCFTWDFVRRLEHDRGVAVQQQVERIDFDRLPMDEHDLDPDRIAYARTVQASLVLHAEQVDQTPIDRWIATRRAELEAEEAERAQRRDALSTGSAN